MDWKSLGPLIGQFAPTLGKVIGGVLPIPFGQTIGETAGRLVAHALGVPATPDAVREAVTRMPPDEVAAKLADAEREAVAKWQAMADMVKAEADLGKTQVSEISETMRAELQLAGLASGGARNAIALMQAGWRPFLMYVWGLSWPFQIFYVLRHAYAQDAQSIAAIASLLYGLAALNGVMAGVAGVYAWGRTREKIADAVPLPAPIKAAAKVAAKALGR